MTDKSIAEMVKELKELRQVWEAEQKEHDATKYLSKWTERHSEEWELFTRIAYWQTMEEYMPLILKVLDEMMKQ